MRRPVPLRVAALLMLAVAAGCGQKGALYLPDRTRSTVPAQSPAPPAIPPASPDAGR